MRYRGKKFSSKSFFKVAEGHSSCHLYYKILSKGVFFVNNLILEILRLDFRLHSCIFFSSWFLSSAVGRLCFLAFRVLLSGLLTSDWRFIRCSSVRGGGRPKEKEHGEAGRNWKKTAEGGTGEGGDRETHPMFWSFLPFYPWSDNIFLLGLE